MALTQRDHPHAHWEFSHSSGDLLRLVPERGGLVSGWRCGGREMLYLDEERFADASLSVRGGIPVLFPICGGLPGNVLPLEGKNHPIAQHGFARDLPWTLQALDTGDGVRMELRESPVSLASYPFPFRLALEARLAPGVLELAVIVENSGDRPLPFSAGLHPYFRVASLAGARLEGLPPRCVDHRTMAEASTAEQLAGLSSGVDLLAGPVGAVHLLDEQGQGVALETTAPFDLVVVWSEPPRPMVCLEPWSSPRQSLISGDRRLVVAPGERTSLRCRYRRLPVAA
jgi:galactose mutarotase-like enzyme